MEADIFGALKFAGIDVKEVRCPLGGLSNIAYAIGNSPATVAIHDSPYGVWNIANFTLEELTLPNFSGEDADFDHDHRFNFVEYASNTNPKFGETNAPLMVTEAIFLLSLTVQDTEVEVTE